MLGRFKIMCIYASYLLAESHDPPSREYCHPLPLFARSDQEVHPDDHHVLMGLGTEPSELCTD